MKIAQLLERIHKYHQQIIQQTGEFIDNDIIQTFIDKLQLSRHILFAGLGSSGLSATEFYYRMIRMGLKGNVTTDSHLMKISASLLSHSDMFIAMSNSGNTSGINFSSGSRQISWCICSVAITNFEGSKLTDCADLVLLTTDQSRNTDHQFINTQIATLFLIDIVSYHLLENTNLDKNLTY
ncbi:MurR/RpiR family transcriptional regulator [Staphylococcus aureus]